jgi:hypothetical protein
MLYKARQYLGVAAHYVTSRFALSFRPSEDFASAIVCEQFLRSTRLLHMKGEKKGSRN